MASGGFPCTRTCRALPARSSTPLTTRAGSSCPRAFASASDPNFVLTIAPPDGCLALYPSTTWVEYCERLEAVPKKDERYRRFVRYLFANTEEVGSDNQGRVVSPGAPASLRRHRRVRWFRSACSHESRSGRKSATSSSCRREGEVPALHGRARTLVMWALHDARCGAAGAGPGVSWRYGRMAIYVDATFGAGGHSRAILSRLTSGRLDCPGCRSRGGRVRARRLPIRVLPSFMPTFATSPTILDRLRSRSWSTACSSTWEFRRCNLTTRERGFSFGKPAPLDMRMNPYVGRSAYDILATASERELADIFFYYGEERAARRIARAIVARRAGGDACRTPPPSSRASSPASCSVPAGGSAIHPATRVFQALRIAVNDELDALSRRACTRAIGRLARRGARRRDQLSLARGPHREAELPRRRSPRRPDETARRRRRARGRRESVERAALSCAPPNGRPADGPAALHRTALAHSPIRAPRAPRPSAASCASRALATPAWRASSIALVGILRRCSWATSC